MFDPNVLGNILPVTVVYINHLLEPYADALSHADSIESLIPWIQQVDPEKAQELISDFEGRDLENCKTIILYDLALYLDPSNDNGEYRTPWDIAEYRSEDGIRLFGAPSKTLPVIVTYGNNAYQHEFTEEFTYGVLVALDNNPNFRVSLFGYVLSRDDLDFIFVVNNENDADQKYVVNHNNEIIAFNSNEFIQGVMTAAEWIGVDAHNIVNDLRYIDGSYNVTRYNF